MKAMLGIAALLVLTVPVRAADDSKVTFISHETTAKGGNLVTAPNLIVLVNRRTAAGQVELHDRETDTFYVLDGAATVVTGGTMIGAAVTGSGQQRGTAIEGGQTYHVAKGDVMVIPAGVPHWFKDVPASIDYYVVKVVAP
jgi:mannose-6-phosphate isomerase-like protein (cupin superfamily)